jgi:hypothetical protein
MIKATDLRIGNWILDPEVEPFYFQVEEIRKHVGYDLWAIYRQGSIKAKEVEGIPLNEEWLLKMGFKLSYTNPRKCFIYIKNNVYLEVYLYKNGRIDLEITKTIFEGPKYRNRYVKNMYLHEYQNLVFSITGEELTINEKYLTLNYKNQKQWKKH